MEHRNGAEHGQEVFERRAPGEALVPAEECLVNGGALPGQPLEPADVTGDAEVDFRAGRPRGSRDDSGDDRGDENPAHGPDYASAANLEVGDPDRDRSDDQDRRKIERLDLPPPHPAAPGEREGGDDAADQAAEVAADRDARDGEADRQVDHDQGQVVPRERARRLVLEDQPGAEQAEDRARGADRDGVRVRDQRAGRARQAGDEVEARDSARGRAPSRPGRRATRARAC